MNRRYLFGIGGFILMFACKTPGVPQENNDPQTLALTDTRVAAAAPRETEKGETKMLLQKRIGVLSKADPAQKLPKPVICTIKNDDPKVVKLGDQVQKWLTEAAGEEIKTGYHIVARVPSLEIIAFSKNAKGEPQEIILMEDYSAMKFRESEGAKKLVDLANDLCPDVK